MILEGWLESPSSFGRSPHRTWPLNSVGPLRELQLGQFSKGARHSGKVDWSFPTDLGDPELPILQDPQHAVAIVPRKDVAEEIRV